MPSGTNRPTKSKNSNSTINSASTSSSNTAAQEDKYRQINAQLEAKTAKLIQEADEVLQQASLLDKPQKTSSLPKRLTDENASENEAQGDIAQPESHQCTGTSENLNGIPVHADEADPAQGDVLVHSSVEDDDILPGPAAKLSLKAQNRYLKAKVRVLQEENQKLSLELNHYHDESNKLTLRMRELEDDRNRLHRVTSAHSSQLEKLKKSLEEAKSRGDALETEKNVLRKDADSAKRVADQQAVSLKSINTRFSRSLEEVERQRVELDKLRNTNRENADTMRHQIEQLTADNRRLERQKADLIGAFKKQLRLIDVLRRQKMLIEASKCLQLTEEDFLRALDWQTS